MSRSLFVAVDTLHKKDLLVTLLLTMFLILGIGALILVSRVQLEGKRTDESSGADGGRTLLRSWLAAALVSVLLLLAVGSLFIDDSDLRSLLMGGVIASAGTATAFYFASKASEQTQRNLLDAAFTSASTIVLPDLAGKTVSDARTIVTALRLKLDTEPTGMADTARVASTRPSKGATLKPDDTVTAVIVTVPDVKGKTIKEARKIIEAAQLKFSSTATDTDTVVRTDPAIGSAVAIGDTVTAFNT
jgi:hypothetical protein